MSSTSYTPLPPAFVPISVDTSELLRLGRTLRVVHHDQEGDVTLSGFTAGFYSSLKLPRAEAQALVAELQRVLALSAEVAS